MTGEGLVAQAAQITLNTIGSLNIVRTAHGRKGCGQAPRVCVGVRVEASAETRTLLLTHGSHGATLMTRKAQLEFGGRALWVLFAVAGTVACAAEPAPPAQEALPRISVQVAPARRGEIGAIREITGTVRAKQSASIAPNVMGTVKAVDVVLGSRVQIGESRPLAQTPGVRAG
jgi:hypothetical protein